VKLVKSRVQREKQDEYGEWSVKQKMEFIDADTFGIFSEGIINQP
jgi:hypothetical protein